MNPNRTVLSFAVLGAGAFFPLLLACQTGNQQPANTAPSASVAYGYPPGSAPPGYPAYPPPPGYPAQQGYPPPGYPAQQGYPPPQAGYPPQQGYPPAQSAPPGYPAATQPPAYPPAPQPTGGAAPAPTASSAPPPLAPSDPNSLQAILQGIQNAVQGTMAPGGAGGSAGLDLTEAGLKAFALKAAPGMQPEGDEMKQSLTQGQHAVMMLTLQAGKCYTVVAFSAPGAVQDVDLNLLAPPLWITLAGQDMTHNNTPTIGAAPNPMCPVIALPLQYKLDVFARQGSGVVAVQLYAKAKS